MTNNKFHFPPVQLIRTNLDKIVTKVNRYLMKTNNFTIYSWKTKEKWGTQQVNLRVRKKFTLQKDFVNKLQHEHS